MAEQLTQPGGAEAKRINQTGPQQVRTVGEQPTADTEPLQPTEEVVSPAPTGDNITPEALTQIDQAMAEDPDIAFDMELLADIAAMPKLQRERQLFHEQNPVMQALRAEQKRTGTPPDQIPPGFTFVGKQTRSPVREQMDIDNPVQVDEAGNVDLSGFDKELGFASPDQAVRAQVKATAPQADRVFASDPEADKLLREGYDKIRKGTNQEFANEAVTAEIEHVNAQLKEVEEQSINDEYLENIEKAQDYAKDLRNQISGVLTQIQGAKVDPYRYWKNRSTHQKIMIGAAAFMNGLAGADDVVKMVENAVDADVKAQIEDVRRLGGMAKNMVNVMDKTFKNKMDVAKIMRVLALEEMKNKMAVNLARTKSVTKQFGIAKKIGEIDVAQAKYMNQMALDRFKARQQAEKDMKVGAEEKKMILHADQALMSLKKMKKALFVDGQWTFDPMGNDFTMGRKLFVDAMARLQSGAAITEKEFELYESLLPTARKSAKQQAKDFRTLELLWERKNKILMTKNLKEMREARGNWNNSQTKKFRDKNGKPLDFQPE